MFRPRNSILYCLLISVILVSCNRTNPLFITLPASQTHIDFVNRPVKKDLLNILYYLYYYNGGGVAIGDINNDGLPDIYFTANDKGHNKLYLNKGNFEFEDITDKAGVAGTSDWCTGVTMADVNGDGLLDIYVCAVANMHGLKGHNELFLNKGNGRFTESAAKYGLNFSGFSTQAVFFDYDHDGDLDCYLLNQSSRPNQNIVDTANRRKPDSLAGDRLYRNDSTAEGRKFTDVSAAAGIYQSNLGYGLGVAVADFNNDGWEDIYVGNDFHENDYYYLNNGNGSFTECGAKHFGHYSRFSMGNDAADVNNDGQMDIVTVDMLPPDEKTLKTYGSDEHFDTYNQKIIKNGYQNQVSRNCLQINNGNGVSFSDIALMSGISATDWSWSPLFADFDNDGNKDLFVSSGIVKRPVDMDYIRYKSNPEMSKLLNSTDKYDAPSLEKMPDGASHPFLYRGDGGHSFKDLSENWGTGKMKGYYNGAAYADLNNDGKLDLVINCLNAPALVLKNNSPKKNYFEITFHSNGMNTSGIGAKAWLFSGNKPQYQQLMLTRGFMSSSEPRLHFGLDSLNKIDSLVIVWPDQQYELIKNPRVNTELQAEHKNALQHFEYDRFFKKSPAPLINISGQIGLSWRHQEDPFIDFNIQYLIPHMESTRGPKLAVADVNKDGLEDFFVCGAKGQPGALMIQTKNGRFISRDTATFNKNTGSESVDAVFFDVNQDGSPDLLTITGGNEYENGNPRLADHLYLNDGKGNFTEAPNALPGVYTNKSCVAVADVNHDGSSDLFIGGFADAKRYGYSTPSQLLLNDGKGNFTPADTTVISLRGTGMITSAVFSDINKDGWMDLIVAGEWMPVTVFMNERGIFTKKEIPNSTGLWQSLYATDINGDGYADLLAGNWGHNSKLWAGKNGPLKMYVKDFDNNGSVEQVMAYTIDGKEYPFLAKDELERALPVLKKAYLTYGEVAGKTVQYMFYDLFKDYKEFSAETLSSSSFLNDGKGNFIRTDLPDALQQAPVFSFTPVSDSSGAAWLAGGNFYGVMPYEGRYDALFPSVFSLADKKLRYITDLPAIGGEIRDMKWINGPAGRKILIVARNNDSLIFLEPPNP